MGDYFYESDSRDWYFKDPAWRHWVTGLDAQIWQSDVVEGWSFYRWPYFYSSARGEWHFTSDRGDDAWVVNLDSGDWSVLGDIDQASKGFAAVPESGENLWWSYELDRAITLEIDGDVLFLSSAGSVDIVHNGDTGRREIRFKGAFNGSIQGEYVSGGFQYRMVEAISKGDGGCGLSGGGVEIVFTFKFSGVEIRTSLEADFDYRSFLSASLSPLLDNDLWERPVGYREDARPLTSISGEINMSGAGLVTQRETFTEFAWIGIGWELIEKFDEFEVNGRVFENVVHVRVNSGLPSVDGEGVDQIEESYYLAKGIGLIQAKGFIGITDDDNYLKIVDSSEF